MNDQPSTDGETPLDNYRPHRVGSHSDDYGGESDKPCFCDLKPKLLAWRASTVVAELEKLAAQESVTNKGGLGHVPLVVIRAAINNWKGEAE